MPLARLIIAGVSRHTGVRPVMGLFLLCVLVFAVYFLGEHAGRQAPSRNQKVHDIVRIEADLKNRKSDLYANYTPPSLLFLVVIAVIVLILMLFGKVSRDDDEYYYHRHSALTHRSTERAA